MCLADFAFGVCAGIIIMFVLMVLGVAHVKIHTSEPDEENRDDKEEPGEG